MCYQNKPTLQTPASTAHIQAIMHITLMCTANVWDAGSKSEFRLSLHGESGESSYTEPIKINDQTTCYYYEMQNQRNFGKISKVQIHYMHNNDDLALDQIKYGLILINTTKRKKVGEGYYCDKRDVEQVFYGKVKNGFKESFIGNFECKGKTRSV